MKEDLELISGNFFQEDHLSPDKRYLYKYFRSDLSKQLVRYYFTFGRVDNFVNHTGLYCRIRWRQVLLNKIKRIEFQLEKARKEFDFEKVALILSGKLRKKSYINHEFDEI